MSIFVYLKVLGVIGMGLGFILNLLLRNKLTRIFMLINFDSFFIKQKCAKAPVSQNFLISNVNPFFNDYLFIEKILNKTYITTETCNSNLYSSFFQYSIINKGSDSFVTFDTVKLDVFSYYLGLNLAFKGTINSLNMQSNDLSFFYYYNQAFSCNSSILNSLELINNKYTRFNYARNRQIILQSGFLSNGTQQAITFFNNLFVRNNNLKVNSTMNTLFSKKLRSQKRFRTVALSFNSTHRFKSSMEAKSFFKIYSVIKFQRNSFLNKEGALFPQSR